jgi:hypothetical protein
MSKLCRAIAGLIRPCCTKELVEDLLLVVLQHACLTGDTELFNIIADKADVPHLNVGLLIAAEHGNVDIVGALVERGATNVSAAVKVAQANKHPQIVSLLVQNH